MKYLILVTFYLFCTVASAQIYNVKSFCNENTSGILKTCNKKIAEIEYQYIVDIDVIYIATYDLSIDKRTYEEQEWNYSISKDGSGLDLISKKYPDLHCWCKF